MEPENRTDKYSVCVKKVVKKFAKTIFFFLQIYSYSFGKVRIIRRNLSKGDDKLVIGDSSYHVFYEKVLGKFQRAATKQFEIMNVPLIGVRVIGSIYYIRERRDLCQGYYREKLCSIISLHLP